jgi:hypothetical protein
MTTFAQVTAVHELYRDEWLLCFGNVGKLRRHTSDTPLDEPRNRAKLPESHSDSPARGHTSVTRLPTLYPKLFGSHGVFPNRIGDPVNEKFFPTLG